MQSVNRIIIVLVGVLYLGLGGLFTGIAIEVTAGEVESVHLEFIIGCVGFSLGMGCLIACTTIVATWFIQKGDCRVGKTTNISLLAKASSLGILAIVIGIHSFTMMYAEWPSNAPFKCTKGCPRAGKCFIPDCGRGTYDRACRCRCEYNYKLTNGTCTECADRFEGPSCSLCKAPYSGSKCTEPAYGYTQSGELREGFVLRDRSIAVANFPVCKPGRCGFDCEIPDSNSLDPGGLCTTLERSYVSSSKSCDLHDECASKWCEGRCESRGGLLEGICYRDSDCRPFSKCTRRLCSANPRWSKCECSCTQGFRAGPEGCLPCPGMATRVQTDGALRSLSYPCSESSLPGEEGLRLGHCFLNLQGETECMCHGSWVGEACQCKQDPISRDLCSACAMGWQLDTYKSKGLCLKCPVLFGDSVDRFLACGGFRGTCKRTNLLKGHPYCECHWPYALDEQGSCNNCLFPFEARNGLCYL